jgi:hypothetical protein
VTSAKVDVGTTDKMPMVRKLVDSFRPARDVIALNEGMVPVILLLLKSKYSTPLIELKELGIVPENALEPRRIFVSNVIEEIALGMVPIKELESK